LLSQVTSSNYVGTHVRKTKLRSRNIFSSDHIRPAFFDYSFGLFGNILYISCRHRQINITEKSLNCKGISRSGCQRGSGSAKSVMAVEYVSQSSTSSQLTDNKLLM